jgi:hypothetical protein
MATQTQGQAQTQVQIQNQAQSQSSVANVSIRLPRAMLKQLSNIVESGKFETISEAIRYAIVVAFKITTNDNVIAIKPMRNAPTKEAFADGHVLVCRNNHVLLFIPGNDLATVLPILRRLANNHVKCPVCGSNEFYVKYIPNRPWATKAIEQLPR